MEREQQRLFVRDQLREQQRPRPSRTNRLRGVLAADPSEQMRREGHRLAVPNIGPGRRSLRGHAWQSDNIAIAALHPSGTAFLMAIAMQRACANLTRLIRTLGSISPPTGPNQKRIWTSVNERSLTDVQM